MGKTKFQASWIKSYHWVKPSKKSENRAYCSMCSSKINFRLTQLQLHEKAKKHKDAANDSSRQSKFVFNKDDKITLTGDEKSKALSTENQVAKAEMIRCIDIIDSNCAFLTSDADNDKYRKMFPDSANANSYQQKADKVKHTIQFGIAPYLKDITLNKLKELPFSFRLDETTTSQIKKQCDGYAIYHSKHFGRIVTGYLGTLFVGKCTADNLLCHLNEKLDKLKLSLVCIISVGKDGPSVNLLFKQKLETALQERDTVLIDVGTCPLHIAFRYLVLISILILIKLSLTCTGSSNTLLKEFMIILMLRHLLCFKDVEC